MYLTSVDPTDSYIKRVIIWQHRISNLTGFPNEKSGILSDGRYKKKKKTPLDTVLKEG